MSVSAAIRSSLKKAKLNQIKLSQFWGTTPQVISNKMRLERWTGEEIATVAELTGGKLVILYPDGEQIPIEASRKAVKTPEEPEKPEAPKANTAPKEKKEPKPKKAPAKPKAAKKPKAREEQMSIFEVI